MKVEEEEEERHRIRQSRRTRPSTVGATCTRVAGKRRLGDAFSDVSLPLKS